MRTPSSRSIRRCTPAKRSTRDIHCIKLVSPSGNFGFTTNDHLSVIRVEAGSVADGRIQVGDVVLGVNGEDTRTVMEMASAILLADGIAWFRIGRKSTVLPDSCRKTETPTKNQNIYNLRDVVRHYTKSHMKLKNITVVSSSEGHSEGKVDVTVEDNKVCISRITAGSIYEKFLKSGDIIMEINGQKVNTQSMVADLMENSLNKDGKVNLRIIRLDSEDGELNSCSTCSSVLTTASLSVVMKSDVIRIAQRERKRFMEEEHKKTGKGILKRHSSPSPIRVSVDTNRREISIGCDDPSGIPLRSVYQSSDNLPTDVDLNNLSWGH
ncbi:hypothetical protein AB6A40_008977 [Gnathostoma spinigerum]|uniref:PDZ domain-containing protein n=1 Tax=Gnathostoma spinigerum TaxID=75299 RepID=A0ABD6EQP2_9BILA